MSISLLLVPIALAIAGFAATRKQETQAGVDVARFQTAMKDARLLQAALESYGCQHIVTGDKLDSTVDGRHIIFEQSQEGTFDAVFIGDIPPDRAQSFLSELHEQYTRLLQEEVYKRLLARAQERGLILETEEVQDDNSVVLTFAIQ